jgi:hypothetical protein
MSALPLLWRNNDKTDDKDWTMNTIEELKDNPGSAPDGIAALALRCDLRGAAVVSDRPNVDPATTIDYFLASLFGSKEPGERVLIWLLEGRRSAWFADLSKAAAYVRANAGRDVYVGVALSSADHGPSLRLKVEGGERMPSSISALWADLDLTDGQQSTKARAPDEATARSAFFPEFPPSMVVRSGGGLHAYWLFREPWLLATEDDVRQAGELAAQWNKALQRNAAMKGFQLDSVGDLPRVLRVPGSMNLKIAGHPRPVSLIEITASRYDPSEFREFLASIDAWLVEAPCARGIVVGKLIYDPAAEPPADKFELLSDIEPKFLRSWNRKRSPREFYDQSASAYDQSLANIAVSAAWSDQEIANLLIATRRKHGEKNLKLRDSYYATTIRKARESLARQMAAEIPGADDPFFGGTRCI